MSMDDSGQLPLYSRLEEVIQDGDKAALLDVLCGEQHRTEAAAILRHPQLGPQLLCEACRLGHENIVTLLTAHCPMLDTHTKQGSPLTVAVECGFVEVVETLLINGATLPDPNPRDKRRCPYYISANHGWIDVLKLLLKESGDPSLLHNTSFHGLLLDGASDGGHIDMLRFCVQAILEALGPSRPVSREMLQVSMEIACKGSHVQVMSYLLTLGAELTSHLVDLYPRSVGELLMEGNVPPISQEKRYIDKIRGHWRSRRLQMLHETWFTKLSTTLVDLDLSNNNLSALPDCLPWGMVALETLHARNNKLRSVNSPSTGSVDCLSLYELDLSQNCLTKIAAEVFCLPDLEKVDLSHNTLGEDDCETSEEPTSPTRFGGTRSRGRSEQPSKFFVSLTEGLWTCFKLKYLDLSYNNFTKLPSGIQSCGSLQKLNISDNNISEFHIIWECPMKELDASNNSLKNLPVSLHEKWCGIEILNLSQNNIAEIPPSVCSLADLTELSFSHNCLEFLPPDSWWESFKLRKMILSHNKIQNEEDSSNQGEDKILGHFLKRSVSSLRDSTLNVKQVRFPQKWSHCLEDVDLSHNRLRVVPPTLCDMTKICTLDLSHNPNIDELPGNLSKLKSCYSLLLNGLKLSKIPKQILQGANYTYAVMAFLKERLRMAVSYNKVKLMVVGRESKGKTTLIDVLQGLPPPPNVATDGVIIKEWKVSAGDIKKNLESNSSVKKQTPNVTNYHDVVFQTWDFAGQSDYYVTHKVFLSPVAIYLVLFDLRLHKEGVDGLRNWLLDIKAHAPNSSVIIVGTFLDKLNDDGRGQLSVLENRVIENFRPEFGYPSIAGIVTVSNHTKENIDELKSVIYNVALNKKVKGVFSRAGKGEPLVGRRVPKSYVDLADLVQSEAKSRLKKQEWPVINEDEFYQMVQDNKGSDIRSMEEFTLATTFLCESGIILHFPNQLRGLNFLYFLDPSWLAQRLSRFITLQASHNCVRDGVMDLAEAQTLLFKDETHKSGILSQYVELLERFEIALQLDPHRLLLPSKLPDQRPGLELFGSETSRDSVFRIYRMSHEPSGFWSRLISLVLVMVKRLGNVSDSSSPARHMSWAKLRQVYDKVSTMGTQARLTYWQKGIQVEMGPHSFCLESLRHYKPPLPPRCASDALDGESDEAYYHTPSAGLIIKVMSQVGDFSLLGFAVDQVDSLLDQWFPGIESSLSYRCERLVPCPGCISLVTRDDLSMVQTFRVQDCALSMLRKRPVCDKCPRCQQTDFPLHLLIPDLLMNDVPGDLHIKPDDLEFSVNEGKLGQGGEGSVYLGVMKGDIQVAIKQNAVMEYVRDIKSSDPETSDSGRDSSGSGQGSDKGRSITRSKVSRRSRRETATTYSTEGRLSRVRISSTDSDSLSFQSSTARLHVDLRLLASMRGMRQEVVLMSQLSHPCIVRLLGVDPLNMVHVLELAPKGSLRSVLSHENLGAKADLPEREATLTNKTTSLRRDRKLKPCTLGRTLSYKIIYQIAAGLKYLHSKKIVYKDLKADNVLVWSCDVEDVVHVKLSDYGLARVFSPQGLRGAEGTVGYQAPEMRYGECYNEKIDIFAFGVVIYETISGYLPFHDRSTLEIPQMISNGTRPELQEVDVDPRMPMMTSLMTECWAQEPSQRRPASDILNNMEDVSFLGLLSEIQTEGRHHLSTVQCISSTGQRQGDSSALVRFWCDNSEGRSYSIIDSATGRFRRWEEPFRGSKVTCMGLTLQDKVIVIGTEEPAIELITSDAATGKLTAAGTKVITRHTPLALYTRNTSQPDAVDGAWEIFVTSVNGELDVYECNRTGQDGAARLVHKQHLPLARQEATPATCIVHVTEAQELWIGVGSEVVIVSLEKTPFRALNAHIMVYVGYVITALCYHRDQVWCLSRKSWEVVELDVTTKSVVCRLNCGQVSPVDGVVAEFDTTHMDSSHPAVHATQAQGTSLSKPPMSHQSRQLHQGLNRKRSLARLSQRRMDRGQPSRHRGHRETPGYQVRSICYVNGTLWIGRKSGEILVINVTANNPHGYEYGQVVALLCNRYNIGTGNGSVDHMVNVSDSHVTVFRTVYDNSIREQRTEIVTWVAYNLHNISVIRRTWEGLKTLVKEEKNKADNAKKSHSPA